MVSIKSTKTVQDNVVAKISTGGNSIRFEDDLPLLIAPSGRSCPISFVV
jgi:hypothetical protein